MKHLSWFVGLLLVTACEDVPISASTGTVTEEIIGTQRVASAYPEAVTVKVNNAAHDFCTGTIVAPRVVLTAAHCVIFNAGGNWTVAAPFAGAQSRTVTQAEKIDSGFPSVGYDDQDTYRDLGFLYPDTGFTTIAYPGLSRATQAAGASVSAIGRKSVSANAALVLSSATPLLAADPGYPNDYRTTRLTDGGDSGGGLFLEGTHALIGSERLFDEDAVKDFWVEYSGTTYDAILARIASHGGYVNLSPTSASLAPLGSQTFAVSAGAGGTYTYRLSTNNSGGSIDATGAYRAGATGSVSDVVTATDSANRTGEVTIVVGAALGITPTTATIPPRGAITFLARDGSGGGYAFAIATNHSGGTIATDHYTAGATGSVSDIVRVVDANGARADATVTVTAGVSITPSNPSTLVGGHVALSATGGSGTGYTWSVTRNGSGGNVDAAGRYVAGAIGPVTDQVTATDALGNTQTVTITVGLPLSIRNSPPSLPPRATVALAPSGGSGRGYVWAVSTNDSGATIDASGNYTAGPKGNVRDIVTLVDSDGTMVTNEESVSTELAITPGDSTVAAGGSLSFDATGGAGDGFAFTLDASPSGGALVGAVYTAGTAGPALDLVTAHDPLGNTAVARVVVLRAPTPDAGLPSTGVSDASSPTGSAPPTPMTGVPDAASTSDGDVAGAEPTPAGGCAATEQHGAPDASLVIGLGVLLAVAVRRRTRAAA